MHTTHGQRLILFGALIMISFHTTAVETAAAIYQRITERPALEIELNEWRVGTTRLNGYNLWTSTDDERGYERELSVSQAFRNPFSAYDNASLKNLLNEIAELQWRVSAHDLARLLRTSWADIAQLLVLTQYLEAQVNEYQDIAARTAVAVDSGERERLDLLLIENELQELRSRHEQANAELVAAQQSYHLLSGSRELPSDWRETARPSRWQDHPAIALTAAQMRLAERQFKQTSAGDEPIEAGLHVRSTGGEQIEHEELALGFSFSIPIGNGVGTLSAASQKLEMQSRQTALAQTLREIERQWLQAQVAAETANTELNNAQSRVTRSLEVQRIAETAYRHGELDTIQWLQIKTQAQTALLELERSKINLSLANAMLNQAGGMSW